MYRYTRHIIRYIYIYCDEQKRRTRRKKDTLRVRGDSWYAEERDGDKSKTKTGEKRARELWIYYYQNKKIKKPHAHIRIYMYTYNKSTFSVIIITCPTYYIIRRRRRINNDRTRGCGTTQRARPSGGPSKDLIHIIIGIYAQI